MLFLVIMYFLRNALDVHETALAVTIYKKNLHHMEFSCKSFRVQYE